ncbi:hypothetical protein [Micromonospora globispora]|uniref:hypothetical protein n=1 Tax=Micromonospora globispora TaxID=1450148 RepID=UPI001A9C772A|nr:hypothetical protein [Micromonospora globispora]
MPKTPSRTALAILAHAFLAAAIASTRSTSPDDLIPVTVNELHRLFNALVIEPSRRHADQLKWSIWRRRHQARARASHYARQALTEP